LPPPPRSPLFPYTTLFRSTELGKVDRSQPVSVTVDAEPGRQFSGKIIQISSESEFTPRNVQSIDERRHQVFGLKIRVADPQGVLDRKSTRLNSSHDQISYA